MVIDLASKWQFPVDTGADASVIPPSAMDKQNKQDIKLFAANSTEISTYGSKIIKLNLNLRRDFLWKFVIADVDKPILGADFLNYFGLLVDIKNKKLIDPLSAMSVHSSGTVIGPPQN